LIARKKFLYLVMDARLTSTFEDIKEKLNLQLD
jgi:hypothetical protein